MTDGRTDKAGCRILWHATNNFARCKIQNLAAACILEFEYFKESDMLSDIKKKSYFGKSTWVIGGACVHLLLLQNKNPSAERKIVTITTRTISSKVSNGSMITSNFKAFSWNCNITFNNLQSVLLVSFPSLFLSFPIFPSLFNTFRLCSPFHWWTRTRSWLVCLSVQY